MDIQPEERIDNIGFGGLKLIQKPADFCYGIDAVILADFAAKLSKKKYAIADLGTGTGIIPLILSHKTGAEEICGIEIQPDSYERAVRNTIINGLEQRIHMINCNVKDIPSNLKGKFCVVTSNPPYMQKGSGIINDFEPKTIARHEIYADIEDFIVAAAFVLADRGEMFMIHRPARLADIMYYARKHNMEPKTMRFVCPKQGKAANIVLIHCIKNAGKELKLMDNLYVYDETGGYTDEILNIYEKNI